LAPISAVERPFAELNSLTIGNWQVIHSATGWQQQPHWLESHQITEMMLAWQRFQPQAWSNQIDYPVVLEITTGSRNQLQHWQLLLAESPMLKNKQQAQAILLSDSEFSRLFPAQLLNHWKIDTP
jgi:2-succinyl-5-enolpyruvyl-6-hydroxy-3-cyclohexene-1-carboxylate synthase